LEYDTTFLKCDSIIFNQSELPGFILDRDSVDNVNGKLSVVSGIDARGSGFSFASQITPFSIYFTGQREGNSNINWNTNKPIYVNSLADEIDVLTSGIVLDVSDLTKLANLKVFIEGPFSGGIMNTQLQSNGYIPLTQPYNTSPWNYNGTESVTSVPADVVDWILVELRTDINITSIVATRAGFLKSDGNVTETDGISPLSFEGISNGNYYIVIHHRNHLSIMSVISHSLTESPVLYNFTTSMDTSYTNESAPMKDLGDGFFGMFSSDATGDGQVTSSDFNIFNPAARTAQTGYHMADWNLDGQVTSSDFNIFNPNARNAARTQVPMQIISARNKLPFKEIEEETHAE